MQKSDFFFQVQRLALAFEKSLKEDLLDLWWEELKQYPLKDVQRTVRFFLESDQKTFPKIGEFKIALRGKERKTPEGQQPDLPSCQKCTNGLCSTVRLVGRFPYSFTFRCSCESGNHYPGLPLLDPFEETLKEKYRRSPAPAPSRRSLPVPQSFPIDDELPF